MKANITIQEYLRLKKSSVQAKPLSRWARFLRSIK